MSEDNVVEFPPSKQQKADLARSIFSAPTMPTTTQAMDANLELIRLQQIYPMLSTYEERENNLFQARECLDVMNNYITGHYLGVSTDPAS